MINIQTSPSLNATEQMLLMIDISTRLAGRKDFASFAIKEAISGNVPANKIIETIKEMAEDNYEGICEILGDDLAWKIVKL